MQWRAAGNPDRRKRAAEAEAGYRKSPRASESRPGPWDMLCLSMITVDFTASHDWT